MTDNTVNAKTSTSQSHKHTWNTIPLRRAKECVRRLQARIAKACKEGNRRKVKDLQRLLQNSFYAKVLAVKRVTNNKGSNTPGVDNVIWDTPEDKMNAVNQLGKGTYKPNPLKRIYIAKSNGKKRPLGIPTMPDRARQALDLLTLDPISETKADGHSYGFRPGRGTADAIAQCFIVFAKKNSAKYILEGDIKACFDEISHTWMLENIPMNKKILGKQLKAGFIEKDTFHVTESGTCQGGINSPTIANMVLDGIEKYLREILGSKFHNHKINIIRYADDFIVSADSKELLEDEIKPLLAAFFKLRGLRLSEEKTIVTHIQEGFTFLGQTIRKFKNKLIIKPSDKSVKTILDKVREICKKNKQATTEYMIKKLNPIIRGWANYHRHVVSSETFSKVDREIHQILWRWAKRRHPKKGSHWIKEKYFKTHGNRNWVFTSDPTEDGCVIRLLNASQTKIKRHVKIKQDANPYDIEWEHYYEIREKNRLQRCWQGKRQAKGILGKQENLCMLCEEEISLNQPWEYHFKQRWIYGGEAKRYNLDIVHPECHACLHA